MRHAVIPVAGLGTRLLPATKSQPKEMLPVAGKPVVQHVVEELADGGVEAVTFVTGRGKGAIEDHFDSDPELIRLLRVSGREELLARLDFERAGVRFAYVRQPERRGLGDAVLRAEHVVGDDRFVVALGDAIVAPAEGPSLLERMRAAVEGGADCVVAVERISRDRARRYGIVAPASESRPGAPIPLAGMIEKPEPADAPSDLAACARYVLPREVFEMLRGGPSERTGEVELTDAIAALIDAGAKVVAVPLAAGERRHDIGSPESYLLAQVELALADPEWGPGLRDRLARLLGPDQGPG